MCYGIAAVGKKESKKKYINVIKRHYPLAEKSFNS
jgi:hypothetical protein